MAKIAVTRLLALGLLMSTTDVRAAGPTLLFAQPPCSHASGFCLKFRDSDPLSVVRSYGFTLPAAGRAQVIFDGTMQCENQAFSMGTNFGVVDLISQIVPTTTEAVSHTGSSGGRVALRLESGGSFSTSLNLHSMRTIAYTSGGPKTVYFRLARLRMDAGTVCYVHSAAFSVTFVPN